MICFIYLYLSRIKAVRNFFLHINFFLIDVLFDFRYFRMNYTKEKWSIILNVL